MAMTISTRLIRDRTATDFIPETEASEVFTVTRIQLEKEPVFMPVPSKPTKEQRRNWRLADKHKNKR